MRVSLLGGIKPLFVIITIIPRTGIATSTEIGNVSMEILTMVKENRYCVVYMGEQVRRKSLEWDRNGKEKKTVGL